MMNEKKAKNIESSKSLCLPSDSAKLLEAYPGLCCDNDYLNFYRYIENAEIEKGKPSCNPRYGETILRKNMLDRHREAQRLASDAFEDVLKLQVHFMGRLMVSVGDDSPYSSWASTLLHPLYGHPYVPSTAFKGVIRHCWISELFDGDVEVALQDSFFVKCFGRGSGQGGIVEEGERGGLIFFEGVLTKERYHLVKDVCTPHYPDYYNSEGKKQPTDDQNPKKLDLIVLENSCFETRIGMFDSFSESELDQVKTVVRVAIEEYGVGAKTAVGYGLGNVTFC